ncbi:mitochondrial seryl-tRNA synthetase [Coniochaeta sp. 2T2.1]|nr:mitochondrial seryl-tRNA synthetase [Coniochaeta sp. 2T2.1]
MKPRHPPLSALRPRRTTGAHPPPVLLRRPHLRPSSSLPPKQPPPPPRPSPSPSSPQQQPSDRIQKILSRLPPRLQKYTSALRAAPVSHVTAFLILHELTAVVPLFALFGLFHYYADVAPVEAWMRGHYGTYVRQGTERFERYFRRKGWFGFSEEDAAGEGEGVEGGEVGGQVGEGRAGEGERMGEDGRAVEAAQARYKIVVEIALAYAITKALLPLRIAGSVWATPWFAGVLVRLRKLVRPSP